MIWDVVFEDELALYHGKSSNASNHDFKIFKKPETLSKEQINSVYKIEEGIENEWKGRRGFSSGVESPPIGVAWGITGRTPVTEEDREDKDKKNDDEYPISSDNSAMYEALKKAGLIK